MRCSSLWLLLFTWLLVSRIWAQEGKDFSTYHRIREAAPPAEKDEEEWQEEDFIPPALDLRFNLNGRVAQDQDQRRTQLWTLGAQGTLFRIPVRGYGAFSSDPSHGWRLQDGNFEGEGSRGRLRAGYDYFNLWNFRAQSQRIRLIQVGFKSPELEWQSGRGYQKGFPLQLRLTGFPASFPEKPSWQADAYLGDQPATFSSQNSTFKVQQSLVGAQVLHLSNRLNIRAAGFRFNQENPTGSSATVPKSYSLGVAGMTLRGPANMIISSDYGRSIAIGLMPDQTEDYQWRNQIGLPLGPGQVAVTWQRIGPKFFSFGNPLGYQDFEGTEIYPSVRILQPWEIYGSYLRSRNNVKRHPVPTKHQAFKSAGTALTFKKWSSRMDWQEQAEIGGPLQRLFRASSQAVFKQTKLDVSGSYQVQYTPQGVAGTRTKALSLGLFQPLPLGEGAYLSLSHQRVESKAADSPLSLNLTNNASISWTNFDDFLRSELDLQVLSSKSGQAQGFSHIGHASLNEVFALSLDQKIRLFGRAQSYDFRTKRLGSWSAGLELVTSFRLQTLRKAGQLVGIVYLDKNRNGQRDPDEPPAPKVPFILADGREVSSDALGKFHVEKIAPGESSISILEDELPVDYLPAKITFTLDVRQFGTTGVEIPVYAAQPGEGTMMETEELAHPVSTSTIPSAVQPSTTTTQEAAASEKEEPPRTETFERLEFVYAEGSEILSPDAQQALRDIASQALKTGSSRVRVRIVSLTREDPELAKRRSELALKMLGDSGLPQDRIELVTEAGEEKPGISFELAP